MSDETRRDATRDTRTSEHRGLARLCLACGKNEQTKRWEHDEHTEEEDFDGLFAFLVELP